MHQFYFWHLHIFFYFLHIWRNEKKKIEKKQSENVILSFGRFGSQKSFRRFLFSSHANFQLAANMISLSLHRVCFSTKKKGIESIYVTNWALLLTSFFNSPLCDVFFRFNATWVSVKFGTLCRFFFYILCNVFSCKFLVQLLNLLSSDFISHFEQEHIAKTTISIEALTKHTLLKKVSIFFFSFVPRNAILAFLSSMHVYLEYFFRFQRLN